MGNWQKFSSQDANFVITQGRKMAKKCNPVYLLKIDTPFEVQTNEGPLTAHQGDYLAHDPISGHVWPVAASYVEQHYEEF